MVFQFLMYVVIKYMGSGVPTNVILGKVHGLSALSTLICKVHIINNMDPTVYYFP